MAWLLDTNVISEIRKGPRAALPVQAWFAEAEETDVYTSVLAIGEIRQGIARLAPRDPASAQKIEQWLWRLESDFAGRILPVTLEIADRWGRLCPGQPLAPVDGLFAATALQHGLVLVTRNVTDVARSGVATLDPFVVG